MNDSRLSIDICRNVGYSVDGAAVLAAPGTAQRQVVSHTTRKGVRPCLLIDPSHPALDCDDQSKKLKPPLDKVTVSRLILEQLA